MFQQLPAHIASALAENQANLPRNPQNAAQINAKIALLQRPNLAAEISNGRFFVEGSVTSTDGRAIAIAALFPEDRLRAEASESVRVLERAGRARPDEGRDLARVDGSRREGRWRRSVRSSWC